MIRMAILASGSGTNAQRLMEHFAGHPAVEVAIVACDRPKAGVVQRAWNRGMPCFLFPNSDLVNGTVQRELEGLGIELIVLAGFMRLLPLELVQAWPERILNIHPALLPKYGGKGMYGDRVHEAVLAAGEKESGITIHVVNERYDEGRVLFQAKCPVLPGDDVAALAQRIHALEHAHYAPAVENFACSISRPRTA